MTLLSLLLVLAAERVATTSVHWQADTYFGYYNSAVARRAWLTNGANSWALLLLIFVPAALVYVIFQQLDSALVELLLGTAVLMICIGCPSLRATYKCYLNAANRGDFAACNLYADQLGHCRQNSESFGQNLVWLNYRHYAAVVIWFIAFGAPGAVVYATASRFARVLSEQQHPLATQANKIMSLLDWVPVRVTALGLLVVGHFSRAFPVWLTYLPDPSISAKTLLCEIAKAAEDVEPDENDCTEEPCTLVRLAKRNIMFILVILSLLTLSGWID